MGLLPPIISSTFPQSTPGPHKSLGYIYLRHLPIHPYILPSPVYKINNQPALGIEEIGYAVYYPSLASSRGWLGGGGTGKGVSWLPEEDIGGVVKGYEKFLGKRAVGWIFTTLRYVAGRLKMPLYPQAKLQPPKTKFPLIIFSHGLAGTRNAYSQYCSALASEGYVVLAIEHRDGSGPAISLPPRNGDEKPRTVEYIKHEELDFSGSSEKSLTYFRTLQLDIRQREVYETYNSFKALVEGGEDAKTIFSDKINESDKQAWVESFRGMVDFDDLYLTGHSFGGGTVFQTIQSPPPTPFSPLPVKRAIALDPWLEPLPLPSSSTSSSGISPPVLVINSSGFTEWSVHFQRLLGMMKKIKGDLVTIVGANHQAFSDFLILIPPTPNPALAHLKTMHNLSHSFLLGDTSRAEEIQTRSEEGKVPDGGVFKTDKDGKMVGKGEVVIHLLGA